MPGSTAGNRPFKHVDPTSRPAPASLSFIPHCPAPLQHTAGGTGVRPGGKLHNLEKSGLHILDCWQ